MFDAYGTVFDVASIVDGVPPADRAALATLWRDKQLQYAWLRTLQNRYVDFRRVTADALDYALDRLDIRAPGLAEALMEAYRTPAAFPDVADALRSLRDAGFVTAILSNGSPEMLETAVERAGLAGLFDAVLSVDAARVYKTHPMAYQLALDRLSLPAPAIAFQSSNAWDVYAASDFGMRTVWCNRHGARPERLPGAPDREIRTLAELSDLLASPPGL